VLSQRRNASDAPNAPRAANAIPEQQILDATYELLLAVGMRRMSMADIARRAAVSRATLYRRWPNVRAVVGALTTRELGVLAADAFGADGPHARGALVEAVVRVVRCARAHPLTRKIVEVDPDFLLPYLLERRGTSTAAQLDLLEAALRAGDGSIRRGDPAALARAIWLTAGSFALSAPVLADEQVSLEELDGQLRELLDRYLAP
jgi:AcrR family transcriptional regulator